MKNSAGLIYSGYKRLLNYPLFLLIFIFVLVLFAAYQARNFSFDASSDTLVAESDPDFKNF